MATTNFFEKKQPWSEVKDKIISGYLTPYCAKLLATKQPLKIVDCFAGKGKFGDNKDGSPLMIAKTIKHILNQPNSYENKNVEACFIEKKYHDELESNLLYYSNCKVISGSFENNILEILKKNRDEKTNLFLYIDPYGIKSLSFKVFESLKAMDNVSTEILMNFNSFGFLREGFKLLKLTIPDELNEVTFEEDEKNSIEKMNIIANGTYWQDIIKDKNEKKISMYKAEELFISKYVSEVKNIYKYVINIPIKEKSSHLPKYRLVYGTNHPDGLRIMIDEMNRAWDTIIENSKENIFDLFEQPSYYISGQYKLEKEILRLTENEIHIKELILALIDIFGITYRYSEYTDELLRLSQVPLGLFDDFEQKLHIERKYKTKTGKDAKGWDWEDEIYIKRL